MADFKKVFRLDIDGMTASPIFFSDVTKYKTALVKAWYDKGIRTLNDLLKPDGSLMECEEWKRMYNIGATFLDYRSLLRSLPLEWRNSVERRKLEEPIMDSVISWIVSKNSGTSHIRKILVKSKTEEQTNIWEGKWDCKINKPNWNNIYACLQNTPMQYRAIRYKIITRIVGTNSLLERIKIKDSDVCDYCKRRENIEHKFWYCLRVQNFWDKVKEWLVGKQLSGLSNKITIDKVLLGGEENLITNHIISIGVMMIYSKKHLALSLLISILREDFISEKYCAKLNSKMEELDKKWMVLKLREEG